MALYECVFIARQDISATQVEGLVSQFSGIIEENGGKIAKSEMWGLRSLAYKIKKNRKGHYVLLNLDAPSPAVQEMERNMRLSEDVLRYLTIRVKELEEGPSVVMQSRGGRDDRGGRGGRGGRGDFRGGGGRGGDFRGDSRGGGGRDDSRGGGPRTAAPVETKGDGEAKTPEAKTGEVKAEDAKTPEAKTTEVETPEAKTAETTATEVKTPEVETTKVETPEAKTTEAKNGGKETTE